MTETQKWLSWRYLMYRLFSNLWFVSAIWLYFYRIYINDQQIGILDGMAFTIGLLAEVPSGALADKFGRDKIVRIGQILTGIGFLIQAFSSHFFLFFLGQTILMIGASFVSGADEALFFEKLNFKSNSVEWRKLVTRGSQVALIGGLLATVSGGFLHTINPRIPWILTGLSFISASFIIWPIIDTRKKGKQLQLSEEILEYFNNINTGFKQFLKKELWIYVPIIFVVQGLFYTVGWGLLRLILLDRFHFSPVFGSIALATCSLITVGVLALTHRYAEKLSEKKMLSFISLAAAIALLLSVGDIGLWGFFVILILYIGEHIFYPFISEILHKHAPENQRATVLSVGSFLRMLPYIALAPLIGYLNTHYKLEYFLIGWAILISVVVIIYLRFKKSDTKIELSTEIKP